VRVWRLDDARLGCLEQARGKVGDEISWWWIRFGIERRKCSGQGRTHSLALLLAFSHDAVGPGVGAGEDFFGLTLDQHPTRLLTRSSRPQRLSPSLREDLFRLTLDPHPTRLLKRSSRPQRLSPSLREDLFRLTLDLQAALFELGERHAFELGLCEDELCSFLCFRQRLERLRLRCFADVLGTARRGEQQPCCLVVSGRPFWLMALGTQTLDNTVLVGAAFLLSGGHDGSDLAAHALGDRRMLGEHGFTIEPVGLRFHAESMTDPDTASQPELGIVREMPRN